MQVTAPSCCTQSVQASPFSQFSRLPSRLPQTVSYTQFLYPTNVLGGRRNTIDSTSSFSQCRNASHRSLSLGRANSNQSSLDTGGRDLTSSPLSLTLNTSISTFHLFYSRMLQHLPSSLCNLLGLSPKASLMHSKLS